jgi:folate-binding protein YgfZ
MRSGSVSGIDSADPRIHRGLATSKSLNYRSLVNETPQTLLRLTGRDVLSVLHRIGTQALDDLTPGNARMTCFCDFRGRLLHRALVAVDSDAVWLIRPDAPGHGLGAFVDRHVFREDVSIEDLSSGVRVIRRCLPFGTPPRGPDLASVTTRFSRDTDGRWVFRPRDTVLYLVSPRAAPSGPESLGDTEELRVHVAEPRHGHEIAEAFTPYEVGLAAEVHLSKGCYTGQEALMRLITYRSVRRGLFRIGGAVAPPEEGAILPLSNGRNGVITTAVARPDAWSGLAVLPLGTTEADLAAPLAGAWCEAVNGDRPLGLPEDASAR